MCPAQLRGHWRQFVWSTERRRLERALQHPSSVRTLHSPHPPARGRGRRKHKHTSLSRTHTGKGIEGGKRHTLVERHTRRSVRFGSVRSGPATACRDGASFTLSSSPLSVSLFRAPFPLLLPPPLSLLLGAARKKEGGRGRTDPCCDSEGVSLLTLLFFFFFALPSFLFCKREREKYEKSSRG